MEDRRRAHLPIDNPGHHCCNNLDITVVHPVMVGEPEDSARNAYKAEPMDV